MPSEVKSSRPTPSLGLIAVLAAVILIWVFYPKNSNDGPKASQPNPERLEKDEKGKSPRKKSVINNPIILGSHDRLALLEAFSSLDSLIADKCFSPIVLNLERFESEEKFKLAQKFQSEINSYQSMEELSAFSAAVRQWVRLEKTPDDPALDTHLEKFRKLPGGGPFLTGIRDLNLKAAFRYITTQRIDQLQAHKQIRDLKTVFEDDWHPQFMRKGIEVSFPGALPSENGAGIQRVLRYWELSSTRFLLGISGNGIINEHIQGVYPGEIESHPIYSHALNAVLDPVQRRFRTIATYQPPLTAPDPNPNDLFEEVPAELIALMEFRGAIPRAKLFSDWQQGVGADTADEILYSPGFNPHAQILLRQDGLPQPERPAATINLPPVKIESIKNSRVVLKAPALDHNAILLLNDQFGPGWTVTIDGQTAEILRANNNARAVYLKPSETIRTVIFTQPDSER